MSEIWTIRDILLWSSNFLKEKNFETARLDSELLMCHALSCSRIDLYCNYDKPVNNGEKADIRNYLRRRSGGEPVAYIIGTKEFYGRSFKVSPSVLIPRPETEHLIEASIDISKEHEINAILDIGTGSGAIAVTLGLEVTPTYLEAWDVSEEAIMVAESNREKHGVAVEIRKKDALVADSWVCPERKFDLICSNPPYICKSEEDLMSSSVLDFEPHLALFADQDGLVFYEAIASNGFNLLRSNGFVVLEIGATQGDKVCKIFKDAGWQSVELKLDLAGLPRTVIAQAP